MSGREGGGGGGGIFFVCRREEAGRGSGPLQHVFFVIVPCDRI